MLLMTCTSDYVPHRSIHRTSETDGPAPEVVRPDDAPVEEHYEVELGAIKRRFEKIDQNPSPASNTTKVRLP